MSITMLQHFDYPETLSYEGNATLSDASKFGKACAYFRDSTSCVKCTNTTGVFNLSASGNAEAECFVKIDISNIDSALIETVLKAELAASGYKIYNGHAYQLITIAATQDAARTICESMNGYLAVINSKEEFDYLCNWVGDTRTWVEGTKGTTSDLSSVLIADGVYKDYSSYPFSGAGSYTGLFIFNSGYFADESPNSTAYQYICEWDTLEKAYASMNGYRFFNGHTFKYYTTSKSWLQAKAYCEKLGGHLATITNAETTTILQPFLLPYYYTGTYFAWIGGSRNAGEYWSYTNWDTGCPGWISNNDGAGVAINFYDSSWRDLQSVYGYYFICEWDYDIREQSFREYWLQDFGIDFYSFNGHTFRYYDYATPKAWREAKAYCEKLGGHLATSTSAEKNTLLTSCANNNSVYLGGFFDTETSSFTWITNEKSEYTNWENDAYADISYRTDLLGLYLKSNSKWNRCSLDSSYTSIGCICEWDKELDSIEKWLMKLNYKFFDEHMFKTFENKLAWSVANIACEAMGGHLVNVTSQQKNEFLNKIAVDSNDSHIRIWTGGYWDGTTITWRNDETSEYANWESSLPFSLEGQPSAHYIYLNYTFWNANDDDPNQGYICEWDYDMSDSGGGGVSSGNIFSVSDNSNVVSSSDAETQGYKFYNGHTFKVSTEQTHWENAKVLCENLGGHLATSTSAEKEVFIENMIDGSSNYWLGGKKINDAWTWVTDEEWNYTNWSDGQPNNNGNPSEYLLFWGGNGKRWDDEINSRYAYCICEWNYDIREAKTLTLSINKDGTLNLKSAIWDIDSTSTLTLEPDTWHHVLLRLADKTAKVFLDGAEAINTPITSKVDISPEALTLGGYVGYMDEFVFRDGAGTGSPTVPISAYDEFGTGTASTSNNAPVTRAVWSCENLPEGLTLSSSGVLSGHPTTAGTYNCNVQVATNWGTATKTITIRVNEV